MTRTEIETEIRDLLAKLGQPDPTWTLDHAPRGDGTPHAEGDGPFYELVVDADGAEISREAVDGYEMIYQIMFRRTRAIAMAEEERHRITTPPVWLGKLGTRLPDRLAGLIGSTNYSRVTWIDAHVRLMDHLRGDWGARAKSEHDCMLRRYPLTRDERAHFLKLDLRAYGVGR
ncbi:hypothetical protein [Loktanella sp. SALINAS62]|uniref:hypothetical protein n=1 Tax=Loktanella sp. SALINAS62 TaxID=2706124 RepID=UPI001B8B6850|nr:hypothetical protein [Loktanella sp. SALINAS62]MBS1304223.1 hypothetical protein [Loktanella sp. SALINAS62]